MGDVRMIVSQNRNHQRGRSGWNRGGARSGCVDQTYIRRCPIVACVGGWPREIRSLQLTRSAVDAMGRCHAMVGQTGLLALDQGQQKPGAEGQTVRCRRLRAKIGRAVCMSVLAPFVSTEWESGKSMAVSSSATQIGQGQRNVAR